MSSLVYAIVIYLIGAIAVTYPLILTIGHAVSDPVDPLLNTWILAFEHHTLLTQPREVLNANIFYPYKQTLLFSETLWLPACLLLPVRVSRDNAMLTHNVLVLLGFTLTGSSGYLLGLPGAGLAFGIWYAFHPAAVELVAYQWQQAAERIVPRLFVGGDGETLPSLNLPLTIAPSCVQ